MPGHHERDPVDERHEILHRKHGGAYDQPLDAQGDQIAQRLARIVRGQLLHAADGHHLIAPLARPLLHGALKEPIERQLRVPDHHAQRFRALRGKPAGHGARHVSELLRRGEHTVHLLLAHAPLAAHHAGNHGLGDAGLRSDIENRRLPALCGLHAASSSSQYATLQATGPRPQSATLPVAPPSRHNGLFLEITALYAGVSAWFRWTVTVRDLRLRQEIP